MHGVQGVEPGCFTSLILTVNAWCTGCRSRMSHFFDSHIVNAWCSGCGLGCFTSLILTVNAWCTVCGTRMFYFSVSHAVNTWCTGCGTSTSGKNLEEHCLFISSISWVIQGVQGMEPGYFTSLIHMPLMLVSWWCSWCLKMCLGPIPKHKCWFWCWVWTGYKSSNIWRTTHILPIKVLVMFIID